jgi:putative (di)nucleoside polyphosphate hydrolase
MRSAATGFTAASSAVGRGPDMKAKMVSCGVLVTDGVRLLLGHAPLSPRWDIPKGIAEPGEDFATAARRELREETGLDAPASALRPLGVFPYLPGKDLALFLWTPPVMPDPQALVCTSHFTWRGRQPPEFDRFGLFARDEALRLVGKNMARVLAAIPLALSPDAACGASN